MSRRRLERFGRGRKRWIEPTQLTENAHGPSEPGHRRLAVVDEQLRYFGQAAGEPFRVLQAPALAAKLVLLTNP